MSGVGVLDVPRPLDHRSTRHIRPLICDLLTSDYLSSTDLIAAQRFTTAGGGGVKRLDRGAGDQQEQKHKERLNWLHNALTASNAPWFLSCWARSSA